MSQRSLHICFLSNSMGVGGTDRQILYVAHALQDRGHTVKIISLRPPREMGRKAQRSGLAYESPHIKGSIPYPASMRYLWSRIEDFDPDVLCCFLYHANMLGRVIGTAQDVPVVATSIRNEDLGGGIRERMTRLTDCLDDVVTTNSETVAESLVKRGIVKRSKIETIHNAIDADAFLVDDGVDRDKLSVNKEAFLWITVGRLNEQKDHETLLRAVEVTGEGHEVLIVGDGGERAALTELAKDLGVDDRIHFLGERHDVPALLATADAFVLSSAWEGLPNVVMEALAAELPVVSTNVGGVSELVEDGESGMIVPPGDPEPLAKTMDKLVALGEEARREMGKYGRAQMESAFSIEAIAEEWELLFLNHLLND